MTFVEFTALVQHAFLLQSAGVRTRCELPDIAAQGRIKAVRKLEKRTKSCMQVSDLHAMATELCEASSMALG